MHHAFKICILAFRKGKPTPKFNAAFRINPREAVTRENLTTLFNDKNQQVEINVELVRRLSPDSLSVMEFKSERDVEIAEKMLRLPLLGEKIEGDDFSLQFHREFHMTDDAAKFLTAPTKTSVPLFEGKMIWQFSSEL